MRGREREGRKSGERLIFEFSASWNFLVWANKIEPVSLILLLASFLEQDQATGFIWKYSKRCLKSGMLYIVKVLSSQLYKFVNVLILNACLFCHRELQKYLKFPSNLRLTSGNIWLHLAHKHKGACLLLVWCN